MIKEAIIKLSKRQDLTYKEAEQVMNEIMENTASDVQKAAPPLLLSSLLPAAFPLPSMATGQPPPNPEPLTFSKPSA